MGGQIGQVAYAAAKAGVAGMTLPAARDLAGHGIRVVGIAPGVMETPMTAALPAASLEALGAGVPHPPAPRPAGRVRRPRGPRDWQPLSQRGGDTP